jgi:hypothetical protein
MNPVHRGQLPKEPLINSRLLSPNYGVCGKAPCEGNVEHIGEKGNEVHRPRHCLRNTPCQDKRDKL